MFSRFFIRRPIFASVVSIIIVILGAVSVPFLPVENVPDITPPTVQVTARYPGAGARVVAETVARPIEDQVNGVEGMIYMSSTSSNDGSMALTVTFEVGTDVEMATVWVQNRVALAEPMLPEEVRREGVSVKKKSTNMALVIALVSPDGSHDAVYLSNFASAQVKDVLGRVPGVGDVGVFGAKDFSMRIWLDPEHLTARRLTTDDVLRAIREQNVVATAGQIGAEPTAEGQAFQYTLATRGRLTEVEQFENIIVRVDDGRILRLKDVARVELGSQSYSSHVRLDGFPAVGLAVYQTPGTNALEMAGRVRAEMDRLARSFPDGVGYVIANDTTQFISASIREVIVTLCIAVVLVALTVYVFLQRLRLALIPLLTIPVSLIGTFVVMAGLGLSMNTLTLFGLVLAIGIVVDDAIVVVENTMRIIDEQHLEAKEAAVKAMGEVTGPVVATTLVLLAVFIPTAMMSGITGRLYQQFALTISAATVFSTINALTLAPALCGILLRPTPANPGWFFCAFDRVFEAAKGGYVRTVRATLRHKIAALAFFAVLLGLTALGMKLIPAGFIPAEDQGYFFVNVDLPQGASLQRTRKVTDRIGRSLRTLPAMEHVFIVDGFSMFSGTSTPNGALIVAKLKPWGRRTAAGMDLPSVMGKVRRELMGIQEALCFAFAPPVITGIGNASGFEFQLQDRGGSGWGMLEAIGRDVVDAAQGDPLLTRMNSGFRANVPQAYLEIDAVKAKRLGISLDSIHETLRTCFGSAYVNDFDLLGRAYRVTAQADHSFRDRVERIGQIAVRDAEGDMIPLSTLLTVQDIVGPQSVTRFNQYPSSSITGQTAPGHGTDEAISAMEALAEENLPPSMGFEWSGLAYEQQKAGGQTVLIYSLAFVMVFLFLAAQYESWSTPMAVILSVPVAVFGALAGLWIAGMDTNVYTQIGLVLLIGLASKYSIMLVEFAKQRGQEGLSAEDAALDAANLRYRPILMTALSFILGVVPLVIATGAGAAARRAVGTAVFGGTIAATILGVLLVPVLYVVVHRLVRGRRGAADTANG